MHNERIYNWCHSLECNLTPAFVINEDQLRANLAILNRVQQESGAKILLAQKAYSAWATYPFIAKTLAGTCASSIHEARLGREEFGKEVHSFAAAYSRKDIEALMHYSDHIVFNSFSQWEALGPIVKVDSGVSCGIRVNPQHSEGDTEIYDPCAPFSRLGVTKDQFREDRLTGIEGLHFHTLCEDDSYAFERTLKAFEKQFGHLIPKMKWMNFGGGHHITRADYDVDHLISVVKDFRERYDMIEVYLEPGEAVALDAGVLVTTVLDVIHNGMDIAILDTSATCHMPDVLEMPYRPHIIGSGEALEKQYTYRLAGLSCLAGDVVGDYSFDKPLTVGDRLIFTDMAIYTMVKTNTFNGIQLPAIMLHTQGEVSTLKQFDYDDFKERLS